MRRRFGLALASAVALSALGAGVLALFQSRAGGMSLDGRLGGHVTSFDRTLSSRVESSGQRRIYLVAEGRLLLDLTVDGRVRQVTLGRDRGVNETWEPDPRDWTIEVARGLAARYLPPDARRLRSEPFVFRDREAGTRDVYQSQSLSTVLFAQAYAASASTGPPGACAVTYYRTTTGAVAFLLVGLQ